MKYSAIALFATFIYAVSLASQTPGTQQAGSAPAPSGAPTIRLNTQEVNLDMVFTTSAPKRCMSLRMESNNTSIRSEA